MRELPAGEELWHSYRRGADGPWHLRANMVMSLDGACSVGGFSEGLSSPADRRLFHLLRAQADAVVVGARTVERERYRPPRVRAEFEDLRRSAGKTGPLRIVVISGAASLDPDCRLLSVEAEHPVLVAVTEAADPRRVAALAKKAEIAYVGEEALVATRFRSVLLEKGIRHVLCEGGPHLLGSLLEAGAVDELCLTLAMLVAGEDAPNLIAGRRLAEAARFDLWSVMQADGSLFLRLGPATAQHPAGRG